MDAHSNPRRALKSAQEQEDRRWRRNERDRARRAAETAEQRSERLRKRRERDRARRATPTAGERQATSQQKSTRERERMAAETTEVMSTNQRERLAVETPEERELRLECCSTWYMEQQSVQPELPLFQQCSIQAKMRKFHANMATLDTPTCSTCSERFPSLHFHSKSNECLRCSRDKHIPKLYSSANMNPGPIPPQLQVSNIGTCIHIGALTL